MFAERPLLRWLVVGLAVPLLVGSHWLAYRRGTASEYRRTEVLARNLFADWQAESFDSQLQALRLLARDPNALPGTEREAFCRRVNAISKVVEAGQVAHYRELGDDAGAERWRQKVTEARSLIAKVEPSVK